VVLTLDQVKVLADRLCNRTGIKYIVYLCSTGTYELTEINNRSKLKKEQIKYITGENNGKTSTIRSK